MNQPIFNRAAAPHAHGPDPETCRLADFPDVASLSARMGELNARAGEIERRLAELRRVDTDDGEAIRQAADALIEGRPVGLTAPPAAEIERLNTELAIVAAATTKLRPMYDAARAARSLQINLAARPAHRAIVQRMAAALRALSDACLAEEALRASLVERGAAVAEHILPMSAPYVVGGRWHGPDTSVSVWFGTAAQRGLIETDGATG